MSPPRIALVVVAWFLGTSGAFAQAAPPVTHDQSDGWDHPVTLNLALALEDSPIGILGAEIEGSIRRGLFGGSVSLDLADKLPEQLPAIR